MPGRDTKRLWTGTDHTQSQPMPIDHTVLYEEFLAARLRAVELTDAYREMPADDPCRPLMWDGVVRQTEHARSLLESWLGSAPTERETGTKQRIHAQQLPK
jgi:hypothetical protein